MKQTYNNPMKSGFHFFFVFFLFTTTTIFSQEKASNNDSIICERNDLKNQKDLKNVFSKIFVKSKDLKNDTIKEKKGKEFISLVPAIGYAMSTGLTGVLASNVSFYLDTAHSKISSIMASAYYTQYNQYWLLANSNIFDIKHKLNYTGDWRIYKFPTNTFGLGSHNKLSDAVKIDFAYLKIYQVALKEVLPDFFTGLGYHLDYHRDVDETPNSSEASTQINNYGITRNSVSSGISLNALYDSRKNSINSTNGIYSNIQYRSNFHVLGSNKEYQSLLIDLRKYFKLSDCSDNVLAFWSYNNFIISGNAPYLDLPSIGWDAYNNTGRGYVQGRFRGKELVYFESEFRFAITKNRLFGGVLFANAESISEYPSNKFDAIVPGGGVGLRIKVDKNSRVNIAIDYGFGINGSNGLSFNIGEVF